MNRSKEVGAILLVVGAGVALFATYSGMYVYAIYSPLTGTIIAAFISLAIGGVSIIKNLKEWNQYTLEWSITTYNSHQNPIQSDKNGWFIIGNAISIWHNVNIEMNNCVIQTANEVMIVNQLKSSTITIKWKIVSLKWKDFDFVSWAMDIINILWKIILHYKLQVLHLS